jgi:hypothetical protein
MLYMRKCVYNNYIMIDHVLREIPPITRAQLLILLVCIILLHTRILSHYGMYFSINNILTGEVPSRLRLGLEASDSFGILQILRHCLRVQAHLLVLMPVTAASRCPARSRKLASSVAALTTCTLLLWG